MFFERVESGDSAILVHLDFHEIRQREELEEFMELVTSAGGSGAAIITGSRSAPHPKYFVGQGKLDEIKISLEETGAQLVIFNHSLSPSQERNIERYLKCRVLDRTGLILDIFAQRALTHEGKLQVELAQLDYQSTRLIRGWTHLERQKGGIGLRGPGETQLETDRRLLQARMQSIHRRLAKVEQQRNQGRRARTRSDTATISLVGYTNAGKSTLFNTLTQSQVYAADQLFATLDPTLRRLEIPDIGAVVLADTVGFIRHLPHKVVQAFKATLQETAEADLLLHVVDAADKKRMENIEQVENVLDEINALDIPRIEIFNKIDQLDDSPARIERNEVGKPVRIWVSAQQNNGLEFIQQAIAEWLVDDIIEHQLVLKPSESKLRARFYELKAVLDEQQDAQGNTLLNVRLQKKDFMQVAKQSCFDLARLGLT